MCPFAARARYALAAKGIEFQRVETCLNKKADWHKAANGGMVPILETPEGELILESGVLMSFAHEMGGDKGLELYPKDPLEAARMRLQMVKFDKFLPFIFPIYMSRGKDQQAIDNLTAQMSTLNDFCAKVADGKWLSGSDHPTMVDVHVVPICEFMVGWMHGPLKNVSDSCDFAGKAPNMLKLVENFHSHEAFSPMVMNWEAAAKHWTRTMGWEEGVKCQLSLDVLKGVIEGTVLE